MKGWRLRVAALAVTMGSLPSGCHPPEEAEIVPPPSLPPSPYEVLADRCDRGDGPACADVAEQHREFGDFGGAAAYAQRACDLASAAGCATLARAWERGEGVPRDPAAAAPQFVSACLGGHASSCLSAAVGMRGQDAIEFLRRGCSAEPVLCSRRESGQTGFDPLDQKNVFTAMSRRRELLNGCYGRSQAKKGDLRGRVELEIAVAGDGQVIAVAIRENVGAAPELGACVADVVARAPLTPTVSRKIAIVPWRVTFMP